MEKEALARQQFEVFDLDKSGWITTRELACVLMAVGKTEEEAKTMITHILMKGDKDEDMKISWEEFKSVMMGK